MKTTLSLFLVIFIVVTTTAVADENHLDWSNGCPTGWLGFNSSLEPADAGTREGYQEISGVRCGYYTTIYVLEKAGVGENPNYAYVVIRKNKNFCSVDFIVLEKISGDIQEKQLDVNGDKEVNLLDFSAVIQNGLRVIKDNLAPSIEAKIFGNSPFPKKYLASSWAKIKLGR